LILPIKSNEIQSTKA